MAKRKYPVETVNMVLKSPLSGRFFFVRRARRLQESPDGGYEVVGEKVDITESIKPYLQKRFIR